MHPLHTHGPGLRQIDIFEWYGGLGHYQHSTPGEPASISSTYHFGYACSDDKSSYNADSRWYPNTTDFDYPIIDFSAGFHTFGVEVNATGLRFYVDNVTSFELSLPQLCVTDPAFVWGSSPYAPWLPTYGILNTAVTPNANTSWWQTHNATFLVDWVRWYQFVPDAVEEAVAPAAGE